MSEFTPVTEAVRRRWAFALAGDLIHRTDDYFDAFDRWLNQVKAEAWYEGHTAGQLNSDESLDDEFEYIENPYV